MKKLRNKFLTTCCILSVIAMAMGVTACGNGGDNSSLEDSSATSHQHAWKVDNVIDEATCTQGGKAKYICDCGESKTSTLPPNGHDMPETGTILEPTNCDKEGMEEFECTVCHEKMTVPIPMPDHIYGEPVVTVEPGCFTYGETTYTCVNCPDFYTEQIDPIGHADADYDGNCDGCKEFVGVQKLALGESVAPDSGPWHDAPGTFVWYNYDVEKKPAEEPNVVTVTNEKEHTEGNKSIKFDFTNASNVLPGYDVGAYILHIGIDNLEFGANYTLTFYAWASENFNGNINKMLNNNNFGNGASCIDVNYESVYGAENLAGKGWVKVTATFRANWDRLYKSRCAFRLAFDMTQKWDGELYLADFEVANTNYLLVQEGEKPIENKYTVDKDGRYTIEEGGVILSGCGIQQENGAENGKAIGGMAPGATATMTYNIKATEATSGELYLRLACGMDDRAENLTLNQNYMIKINGVEIDVAETALNGTIGWANYFDYYAGEINFVKGNNVVEINYLGVCPHNLDNLKLVLGETVNEKIYDIYEADGEYIIQDDKAVLVNCTRNAEDGSSDGYAIGGMSIGNESSMTFRLTSEKAQNVTLFLRASTGMDIRPEDLTMAKNYGITVNGTAITVADTAMKDALGWANYYEYLAGKLDLVAGENVIEIKFLGTCNYNIDYLKIVVGEIKVNYDVKAEDGEYIIQDEKAALENCVRNMEAGSSDGYAIGGMSIGNEAKMTFKLTSEKTQNVTLFLKASTGMDARPEDLTMAKNYAITVNGTAITVADTAMKDALGWANYYEYLAGKLNLVAGENVIEIKFLGTCNYNIDYLKIVVGEIKVNYDVSAANGEYIIQDEKAALVNCARNAEDGSLDGYAIGGMSIGNEATMTFKITAESASEAKLYFRCSTGMDARPEGLTMAQNYVIIVNGTAITVADTAMADALGWANYYEYLAGTINLVAGENTIEIKFLGTCNYNIDCLKIVIG